GRSAAVSRSYSFSNVTAPFSGAIEFKYRDEELNGIIEDELILNILNGTSWFAYSDNLKNAASNIIFTSSLVTVPPGEMALSSALAVLPVKWSHLNVWRSGRTVKIEWGTHQEYDVSHFIVQKSSNGQNWVTVGPVIPARNTNTLQTYQLTD